MANFTQFNAQVQRKFAGFVAAGNTLLVMDVSKEALWDAYLESFPAEANRIHKERREYDCNCCKQFINRMGAVVAVVEGELVSIWDFEVDYPFVQSVTALKELVLASAIKGKFIHNDAECSPYHDQTHSHFSITKIPLNNYSYKVAEDRDEANKMFAGVLRSLQEISVEACDEVLSLAGDIYRGEEMSINVSAFREYAVKYANRFNEYSHLSELEKVQAHVWEVYHHFFLNIRNTVIGTLLVDITNGVITEVAVAKYEAKVAPENYKRNTKLVSMAKVKMAQEKFVEMGIDQAIYRRFAKVADIGVNDVLFADPQTAKDMGGFDLLAKQVERPVCNKSATYAAKEISIDNFLKRVVPSALSMDMLFTGSMVPNLVSLVAPKVEASGNMFRWDNNFSWAYKGGFTDSVKERVKRAGGDVDSGSRVSLSWFSTDDLDLHIVEPSGNEIYFSNAGRRHPSSGILDVDMNVDEREAAVDAVENISWNGDMPHGDYTVYVKNYTNRNGNKDVGFNLQLEFNGVTQDYGYLKEVVHQDKVTALTFSYQGDSKPITVRNASPFLVEGSRNASTWSLEQESFVPVTMMMNSPNFWEGNEVGNKHFIFMLEGCMSTEPVTGFFNEYMHSDLREYGDVMEKLAQSLKTPLTGEEQVSGVGFSVTKRNNAIVRVTTVGDKTNYYNIQF